MSGGGGGSSQPTQQNVTQTNIPKELMPYAMTNLGKAQALTEQPYQAYQGPQVAGFSDMQNQAFQGIGNQQVAGELGSASNLANLAGQNAGQYGNYQGAQFGNYYDAPTAGSVDLGYQNVNAQNFGGQDVSNYMSPYMQNVVEQQKQGAIQDYARSIPGMGSNAARVGGLGGTRSALIQAEGQRNLGNMLGNIQATGSQAAFQNAQQQFNADQARQMQARLANQQAGLSTNQMRLAQQQGLNQYGLTNAQMRAQYGLAGQQAGEQSRQFGANLGLQGIQQQLAAAGMLGNLGGQRYTQESGINQARLGAGSLQQQQQQRQYDQDMQNFANAQNYPYKQLGFMSDLIRGTPTGSSVSTMYGGQPSTAQTLAGLGVGLGGLYMSGKAG